MTYLELLELYSRWRPVIKRYQSFKRGTYKAAYRGYLVGCYDSYNRQRNLLRKYIPKELLEALSKGLLKWPE